MTLALRLLLVLLLTLLLSSLAYHGPWFDALYSSHGWAAAYIWLAARFQVIGPEQGDNLVLAMTLGLSLLVALVVVGLGGWGLRRLQRRRRISG